MRTSKKLHCSAGKPWTRVTESGRSVVRRFGCMARTPMTRLFGFTAFAAFIVLGLSGTMAASAAAKGLTNDQNLSDDRSTAQASPRAQSGTDAHAERVVVAAESKVVKLEHPLRTMRETEVEMNAGGLAMVLEYLNIEADYDTLMGDSGMAFVWQANTLQKKGGNVTKFLSAGQPFAFAARVDFLSQTLGQRLKLEYLPDHASGAVSLPAFNYEHVLPAVETEVKAGRPVLGLDNRSLVVAGYELYSDGLRNCFFVHWPGPGANQLSKYREDLLGVVAVGDPMPQLDRKEADRAAIQHAVMLGRDTLFNGASFPEIADADADADGESDCLPDPNEIVTSRTYYTGRESFTLWKDSVKDESSPAYEGRGYAYRDLAILRRSAPAYLGAMAARHQENVAAALKRAEDLYKLVLQELPVQAGFDPEHPGEETRQQTADRISRIAELETKAIDSLEEAQGLMQ